MTKKQKNKESDFRFIRKNHLIQELVMIDGIGRSGKGMLAHMLSCFNRVEKQHNLDMFEWIGRVWSARKISDDAAINLLRLEGDTRLYNLFISRDVNFRFSDDTGVFKNANSFKYLKRLIAKPHENTVNKIINEKPIFQTCMHDGIRNAEIYFMAFNKRLKMIYILRDPTYNIFEWQQADFAKSFNNNPRIFHNMIERNGVIVPFSTLGWEKEYLNISDDDKIIGLIDSHFKLNLTSYDSLDEKMKNDILIIQFNELVTNPITICDKIADFLQTGINYRLLKKILKRENCPRIIDPNKRDQMLNSIRKKASKKYRNIFDELLVKYELLYQEKRMIE